MTALFTMLARNSHHVHHSVAGKFFDIFNILESSLLCHFMGDYFYEGIYDSGSNKVYCHLIDFFRRNLIFVHPVEGLLAVFCIELADLFLKMFMCTS